MKPLIPPELYQQFKNKNSPDTECKDMLLWCKLFDPCSGRTRYVADYTIENQVAFGFVEGLESERGDFSIAELEEYTGRLGIGIERDLYYTPCTYHDLLINNQLRDAQ